MALRFCEIGRILPATLQSCDFSSGGETGLELIGSE